MQTDNSERQNPIAKAYGGEGTITFEKDGRLNFYWGSAGDNREPFKEFATKKKLQLNEFYSVTLVRNNATKQVLWYINGELDNTTNDWIQPKKSNLNLIIGNGYTKPFKGVMKNIQLYTRAIDSSEIKKNTNIEGFSTFFTDNYYNI
jgi:hypothetical protein